MKYLIWLAKAAIGFVWFVLLVNIVHPFPGNAAIALYIMTGFLLFMHAIQMLIFIGAFGEKVPMTRWEKWSILVFGIFAMLDLRRKYMT
ncbi:DUF1145 domain-containing protein [Vibrio sp. SCSIO 43136]|uniref:DUF1145 domain-containing protein n=1 Tax=Vibrio sp. SCSIO 43136 TaxID=2819101 RepID=UPI002074BF36|nr:DUF1145 domain-containing protein [Vibrio sp. SCSIO 43136]USD65388.1 DUF1145 domain-containing protein [Vibrio sp. SCSIO 43136]